MHRLITIAIACILAVGGPAAFAVRPQTQSRPSTFTLELPLDAAGRLEIRDVLTELCEELGIAPAESIQKLEWSIDVKSLLGRLQLGVFDRMTGGAVVSSVQGDRVVMTVDKQQLKEKLAEAGETVDAWIADLSGRVQQEQQRSYGVSFVTPADLQVPLAKLENAPERVILLVHGLDDPGFMWRDLIPALIKAGHDSARFEYPNDGPIAEGADLLAATLAEMKKAGIDHVDIVAHSMGGLVARDVLTRPAYYNGDGSAAAAGGRYPTIDRLIMVGTPNHGSKWARLRTLAELREHFYRAWHGQGGWLGNFDVDGGGEAGVDLLPASDFLRRLNARPLATHTTHAVIAGQCGSEVAGDVGAFAERVRKFAETSEAPSWLRDLVSTENQDLATSMVGDALNELGDGCVSLESARLAGVSDFKVVPGNHLSMIVTLGDDTDTPPAIPLILERLTKP